MADLSPSWPELVELTRQQATSLSELLEEIAGVPGRHHVERVDALLDVLDRIGRGGRDARGTRDSVPFSGAEVAAFGILLAQDLSLSARANAAWTLTGNAIADSLGASSPLGRFDAATSLAQLFGTDASVDPGATGEPGVVATNAQLDALVDLCIDLDRLRGQVLEDRARAGVTLLTDLAHSRASAGAPLSGDLLAGLRRLVDDVLEYRLGDRAPHGVALVHERILAVTTGPDLYAPRCEAQLQLLQGHGPSALQRDVPSAPAAQPNDTPGQAPPAARGGAHPRPARAPGSPAQHQGPSGTPTERRHGPGTPAAGAAERGGTSPETPDPRRGGPR
jgi:hypothetical protein